MSEKTVIQQSPHPFTQAILVEHLRRLGVRPGMTLLVHSSLSRIGYVPGGPVTVIQALMDVLTPAGTLVMPTHTSDNSEPAEWRNPPVPSAWYTTIRETIPAFDPARTPTRGMGVIPELFRTWPDVWRSQHPQVSFAAWGQKAAAVTADHALPFGMGERSPLARIYELEGHVLLLGVGYDRNTSFHLAEIRAGMRPECQCAAAVLVNGRRAWQCYDDIDYDDTPFVEIGRAFEAAGSVQIGQIGLAESRLFAQRAAVDFAQTWLQQTLNK